MKQKLVFTFLRTKLIVGSRHQGIKTFKNNLSFNRRKKGKKR